MNIATLTSESVTPTHVDSTEGDATDVDATDVDATDVTPTMAGVDRAILCARSAEENKGKDIVILDMRGITPLFDFQVLASGTSRRQIHTLAEEIDDAMKAAGDERLSIEGYQPAKWVVQDYGDVIVHVFDADTRAYNALEDLWADAPHVDWK